MKSVWVDVQILSYSQHSSALNEQILPIEEAVTKMKEMAKKSYSNKGENIVQANYKAIDAGKDAIEEVTVDPEWSNLTVLPLRKPTGDDYFDNS